MRKIIFLFVTVLFAASVFFFASVSLAQESSDKVAQLKLEKKKNEFEMHKLRVKLIKENPELAQLHKKIMDLQKELSDKIDNTNEMKILLAKAKQLEAEMSRQSLEKKGKND